MATPKYIDRVADVTTVNGTVTISLSTVPISTFQTFASAYTINDGVPYSMVNRSANEWEVGLGTYLSGGRISRDTVLSGSSGVGTRVSFSTGTKDVRVIEPARLVGGSSVGFSFTANFGGVGDGATDNSTAWNTFATAARAASAAGQGVVLYMAPGTYNYDHSLCQGFLQNIAQLRVVGYGAIIQNTYNGSISGHNASFEWPWGPASQPLRNSAAALQSFLIQTTVVAGTSVTAVTAGDAANFSAGEWVLLASLDIQYNGYPPNCDLFEYAKVTGTNAGTGVITLDRFIENQHRSDFPDGGNAIACGKARIWKLNTTGWPWASPVSWDIDHVYEGLTVNAAPGADTNYMTFTGRRIQTVNWTGVGSSESVSLNIDHYSPTFLTQGEPDKLVKSLTYDNMTYDIGARLAFQSSSIDVVVIKDSIITGTLTCGNVKQLTVDGCAIQSLSGNSTQGMGRSRIIRNSRVYGAATINTALYDQGSLLTVDGTNVQFANGTITILKASGLQGGWNVIPGQPVWMSSNTDSFGANAFTDTGVGYVTSLTEDGTNLYIGTTLPFAALPSWFSKFGILREGAITVENTTGCDPMNLASEAVRRGQSPRGYYRYRFMGKFAQGGGWFYHKGVLTQLSCNIRQTSPAASTTLAFSTAVLDLSSLVKGTLTLNFNANTAGLRVLTGTGFSGIQSGDTVSLSGGSITTLPNNQAWSGQAIYFFVNLNPTLFQPWQNPIIDLELIFDVGKIGTVSFPQYDDPSSGTDLIAATVGQLP